MPNKKIYEIPLKDETVRISGLSPIVTFTLEDQGITIQDIEHIGTGESSEKKSYSKLYKVLYYLVVHSEYSDKYRNLQFEEFLRILSPDFKLIDQINMVSELYKKHLGLTDEQIKQYNDSSDKKKLKSKKSTSD